MTASVFILILLLIVKEVWLVSQNLDCPHECECEKTASEFKETFTVYCYRGGLNDSHFSQILEKIPVNIAVLGKNVRYHRSLGSTLTSLQIDQKS